jgi:CheY-like chemotaxis protein
MKLEVILVDDDSVIIFIHKTLITSNNFSQAPIAFSNGKDTLEYLKNHQDKSATIFIMLDINMPEMNGWQFLDALKNVHQQDNLYIVMVTSSIDRTDKLKAKEYPNIVEYIEKPITMAKIEELKKLKELNKFFQ